MRHGDQLWSRIRVVPRNWGTTPQTTSSSIPSQFSILHRIEYNDALSVNRPSWVAMPGVQACKAAVRSERTDPLQNRQVVLGEASRHRFGRTSEVEGNGKPEGQEEGLKNRLSLSVVFDSGAQTFQLYNIIVRNQNSRQLFFRFTGSLARPVPGHVFTVIVPTSSFVPLKCRLMRSRRPSSGW